MKQANVAIYNDLVLRWKTIFNLWFSLPHTASYCIQSCRFSSLSFSFSFLHDNHRHIHHTKHTFIYTAIYTHVLARWLKHVTIHRTHRVFLFLSFSFFPHIQEMDTFLFLESFSLFNFIVVFFILLYLPLGLFDWKAFLAWIWRQIGICDVEYNFSWDNDFFLLLKKIWLTHTHTHQRKIDISVAIKIRYR